MHVLNKVEAQSFVRERLDLFDDAGRSNPFACSAWVLHFIEQVAEEWWTFVVPECLVGGESLMMLYSEEKSPYRRSAATNYYASLYSPMISSIGSNSDRRVALTKLVDQLVELPPKSAVINFSPLDKDATDTAALKNIFLKRGWYVKQYRCFGNWYLPCRNLSFDEYMKRRDSKLRHTWMRKAKKFKNTDDARLEIITNPEDTGAAMSAFDKVYAQSWKNSEPYPTFVRKWAEICAENGWLRLGLAWIGDVPIAAQFWFTMNCRTYIFKLAYDENYASWSAGTVLSAHMFQYVLEQDQPEEIDYLRKR